jgi:hypothetical protein
MELVDQCSAVTNRTARNHVPSYLHLTCHHMSVISEVTFGVTGYSERRGVAGRLIPMSHYHIVTLPMDVLSTVKRSARRVAAQGGDLHDVKRLIVREVCLSRPRRVFRVFQGCHQPCKDLPSPSVLCCGSGPAESCNSTARHMVACRL